MSIPKKRFADMTREELVDASVTIGSQLRLAREALDTTKRSARATGQYLDQDEMAQLERRRGMLSGLHQKIGAELSKRRVARQGDHSFQHWFYQAAIELVDDEFVERIKEHAHALEAKSKGAIDVDIKA